MLSPVPCTAAHLAPPETCPHRSPTGPIPSTKCFHPYLSPRPSKKSAVSFDRPQTMGSSTRQDTEKNPRPAILTTRILRTGDRIDDGPALMAIGRAEPIGTISGRPERCPVRPKKTKKEGYNMRTSQEITHPCTTLAQARLTAEFGWDPVHQFWFDRNPHVNVSQSP